MKYLLQKYDDKHDYFVINDDADAVAGYIFPTRSDPGSKMFFRVENDFGNKIAVVNSIDEAIPLLAAYYEANPPQWEHKDDVRKPDRRPSYVKDTQFATLRVEEIKPGQWAAYRDDFELLVGGKIATFATRDEAQNRADAHMRDDFPNSEPITDGYSWDFHDYDWRKSPMTAFWRERCEANAKAAAAAHAAMR
jgi:hypothetical protein